MKFHLQRDHVTDNGEQNDGISENKGRDVTSLVMHAALQPQQLHLTSLAAADVIQPTYMSPLHFGRSHTHTYTHTARELYG